VIRWARRAAGITGLALVSVAFAAPGERGSAGAKSHNLVAIEFREWPPSELAVAGGFLGVPDSLGVFPPSFQRSDARSGAFAAPGAGAGNLLVFTDLRPGTYRVALFLLEQSRLFRKLLSKKIPNTEDRCLVYPDSIPALTFQVGEGDLTYLGCVVRKTRATLDSSEVWTSWNEWAPGNEGKAWKSLAKRKPFAEWRDLLDRRAAVLDSTTRKRKG
jgi:hypothetical protein